MAGHAIDHRCFTLITADMNAPAESASLVASNPP
jgi:hypothetical protein